jgi:hypothetical protein
VPGTGLLWPGLAQNRAASRAFPGRWPSATRPSFCVGPTPPETRQKLPVDALRQVWQDGGAMNESEKRFSFTRAAPSTSGRAKKQILISISLTALLCSFCWSVRGQTPVVITSFTGNGYLTWTDSGYTDRLYTVEWSSDLTRWTNTWSHLWLQSTSMPTNTVSVPMFYRISAIQKEGDKFPPSPAELVGKSLAIIAWGANPNLRVDIVTRTNGFFQGLDSSSPSRTAAQYVYQVLNKTNAYLKVTWPGMSIEGQMHFYTRSAGTLDQALGKGFFLME